MNFRRPIIKHVKTEEDVRNLGARDVVRYELGYARYRGFHMGHHQLLSRWWEKGIIKFTVIRIIPSVSILGNADGGITLARQAVRMDEYYPSDGDSFYLQDRYLREVGI